MEIKKIKTNWTSFFPPVAVIKADTHTGGNGVGSLPLGLCRKPCIFVCQNQGRIYVSSSIWDVKFSHITISASKGIKI